LKSDPPSRGDVRRLTDHVRRHLENAGVEPLEAGETLVGTGGTLRNLAKIDRRRHGAYPVTRLHGYVLSRPRLEEVVDALASRSLKKRTRIPGLNDDRGDSIVGGGLVIRTLATLVSAPEVCVSGQGVREGLVRGLLSGDLLAPAVVREASVSALAARFGGWVADQARRRAALADALLLGLEPRPEAEAREALRHAARLLDIGRSVDFFERHQHVAEIVLATDLVGFTHRQAALVSAILRTAGDEDTRVRSYAPLLSARDAPAVAREAVLLALADDIEERCPSGMEARLKCRARKDEVVIEVASLGGWRPRTIGRRFERVFRRRLVVKPAG
jgi:exopolyphosphatase/guanosine-5'-triphosphate,3'-diphosphate pyrophosphatase